MKKRIISIILLLSMIMTLAGMAGCSPGSSYDSSKAFQDQVSKMKDDLYYQGADGKYYRR